MPRSIDVTVESPAGVDEVLSTFGDESYWHARLAAFTGGTATLSALEIGADGDVAATIEVSLVRDRLPRVVTQLHGGDLQMVRTERWGRAGDGRVRGDITVAIPGAPFTAVGEAWVSPVDGGSVLTYNATVAVKIPLVGGRIEQYLGSRTAQDIAEIQRFTTEWITERR